MSPQVCFVIFSVFGITVQCVLIFIFRYQLASLSSAAAVSLAAAVF